MHKVEGSLLFSALAGIDKFLLPILFVRFGNPAAGISDFAKRMIEVGKIEGRATSLSGADSKETGPETFIAKLAKLRAQSPQDYEAFRMAIAPDGNVAAGSDTTSITLTAILYNIIKTPRIYQKLRDELAQAAAEGKADDPITFDQAQALPYFQMVVKEAMRVHPATGLPMWRVVQEGGIELGGTHLPAGVSQLAFSSIPLMLLVHDQLTLSIYHIGNRRYQYLGCAS